MPEEREVRYESAMGAPCKLPTLLAGEMTRIIREHPTWTNAEVAESALCWYFSVIDLDTIAHAVRQDLAKSN